MAEKKFLSWLGFKDEASPSPSGAAGASAPHTSTLDRIRELEAELADLRARRDITSLTREEFEILATETATSLIKTAQAREARAVAAAERALSEAQRVAKQLTETAETKARSALQTAEGRGRKYLEAAELEAKEALEKAAKAAQELLDSKHREASTITSAAKREADHVISEATSDIANFRNWLSGAVAESERLQKIQHQALASAEEGIRQTRARMATAFEKLAALGADIESALDENHRPKEREFTRPTPPTAAKPAATKPAAKKAAAPRKSVGRPPKRK
ncbi:MAG: hypothetical protein WCO95_01695 [Actinomycetes bacterium]